MLLKPFARHPVACNLLMILMLLAGAFGLQRLNTQFFPNFELDFITVRVTWTGASAEDVETAIVNIIEDELRTVDGLNKMTSTASEGLALVSLEYQAGTDMGIALDTVKEKIGLIRNLPKTSELPQINRIIRYEPVARLLIYGPDNLRELSSISHQIEHELLNMGVTKVDIIGLPEQEIAIQIPSVTLQELGLSLEQIANLIASRSRDIPAGTVGRNELSRQLRALQQQRSESGFEALVLLSDDQGRLIRIGDVAKVSRRSRARQTTVLYKDQPAVELRLSRGENGDSLKSAQILNRWLENKRPALPPGVKVRTYDQSWELIQDRIDLLLRNGLSGLVLVVLILYLFLNGRVAGWVAAGIPVSFMAALGALYLVGGSINMISLFALIMTLGIIVDDAIVVGEDALTHFQMGEPPLAAAEGGARRMLIPVLSSSLTTIAAFLPLMLVGGIIGNILFDIPLVAICVILASLVESFLILPGHLHHTFKAHSASTTSKFRALLERGINTFRDALFRPLVTACVDHAMLTICSALALLLLTVGLVAGGRVAFNFFPSPEARILNADVNFFSGTPPERVKAFMLNLQHSLDKTQAQLGEPIVDVALITLGQVRNSNGGTARQGDQYANLMVQLVEPDHRQTRNPGFITAWQRNINLPPGLESFSITERKGGPPGSDLDIRLISADAPQLKEAALALSESLRGITGVNSIADDLPYGPEQFIYKLTPRGQALGLTVEDVGRQLRSAYDGTVAQIFQDGDDEIEVRVMLPDAERHSLASLESFNLTLADASKVPLFSVIQLKTRRGFEILRHTGGRLSLRVSADVDASLNNSNRIIDALKSTTLPKLKQRYGVDYAFEGRRADQEDTLADMALGGIYALIMIYVVLSWVFASYGWPLVVMTAIPFGLVGALTGHWLLGIDLTILSLFGLFGLSGIVVNDAIILVVFFKQLISSGMTTREAIIEASCQRLRAVILTSLTTIAGLLPLMFETSLQAQFLIPMATSITFGLAFSTLLVLLVIPSQLQIFESCRKFFSRTQQTDNLHHV